MLRTVCMLSWPTVLEQALQTGAQYVDTAMVGRIGMQASAAVGLTASAMWLITGPLAAIGMGVLSCISKAIGADMNFAWPSSQIAVLGAAGAVNIIHRKDLQKAKDNGKDVEALRAKYIADYERTTVNANLSLEMGEIDAMIDPEQTRETIIESLRLLASKKRVRRTSKHHGNQPL